MRLRAQLSLLFDDEELYNNFVTPYKNQKLLNSIIIKCLAAYYYNPAARDIIESAYMKPEEVIDEGSQKRDEMFDDILSTLMVQDFMFKEMEDELSRGSQDISDALRGVNDRAEQYMDKSTSEYGSSTYKIRRHLLEAKTPVKSEAQSVEAVADNATIRMLISAVTALAKSVGSSEALSILGVGLESSDKVVAEKTIENKEIEVPNVMTQELDLFGNEEPEQDVLVPVIEDKSKEVVAKDGSAALTGLMGSLGGLY